jgi:hypothetical protein
MSLARLRPEEREQPLQFPILRLTAILANLEGLGIADVLRAVL